METNTCFGCFGALVTGPANPAAPACRCPTCRRWYHPACWAKYSCTKSECPGRGRSPATEVPPAPRPPEPVVVNYPYQYGPLNLLTDQPLGVSIGVVADGRIDRMLVRNNSPDPLTVLTPVLPPWLSVRVVRKPSDERPVDGTAVIPPGGTRDLSVALHAVRPVGRRRIELRTVIRHPNGTDSIAGPVVPLEVVSAPSEPSVLSVLLVYFAGVLLVASMLVRALVHPDVGVWRLTFLAALWLAGTAILMPGLSARVLARPLALLGLMVPATARTVGTANAWLMDAEDREDWVVRRLLLAGVVFLLAALPGYLFWGIVTALLDAFTATSIGVAIVAMVVAAATALAVWLPLRSYGGVAALSSALFSDSPTVRPAATPAAPAGAPPIPQPPRP